MAFWSNICRLVLNEPPPYLEGETPFLGGDHFRVASEVKELLKRNEEHPIFLIGPWGSGKTIHVKQIAAEMKDTHHFASRSFYAIGNLRDAYAHLLEPRVRILTLIAAVGLIGIVCGSPWVIRWIFDLRGKLPFIWGVPTLGLLIAYLFGANRAKSLYIAGSIAATKLEKRRRITVIDDLERSSMSHPDQWAMLANLWTWRQRHIILFGYGREEERMRLIERASKLGGRIVFVPVLPAVNYAIAVTLDTTFPFSASSWLAELTPRDLIVIHDEVENALRGASTPLRRGIVYLNRCAQRLLENLEIGQNLRSLFGFTVANNTVIRFTTNRQSLDNPLPLRVDQKMQDLLSSLREDVRIAIAPHSDTIYTVLQSVDVRPVVAAAIKVAP